MAAIQKSDSVTIGKLKITVNELTVRQILELTDAKALKGDDTAELDVNTLKTLAEEHIPKFITGASMEELLDFKPSELKELYEKFAEVNTVFFDVARKAGLTEIVEQLKVALQKDFLKLLADF